MNTPDFSLPPAPAALDAGGGTPAPFGAYRGAVADLSTSAWDGNGGITSHRRRQRKGWIYFGAFTERFMVGFATVDAGYVANAFCYVYDRARDLLVEEAATVPLGFTRDFKPRHDGDWRLSSGGRTWEVDFREDAWQVGFSGKRIELELTVSGSSPGLTAIASSIGRPFAHTYKVCALDAQVRATVDRVTASDSGSASVDFTLGYPPRHTLWNWANMNGSTADGRRVGLNLVGQFMNGQENGLWIGDELVPLGHATFEYDPRNPEASWRIRTLDGLIDLTFEPEGQRQQQLRAGIMASVFVQPFGRFAGVIRHRGETLEVTGLGVVEEHLATW